MLYEKDFGSDHTHGNTSAIQLYISTTAGQGGCLTGTTKKYQFYFTRGHEGDTDQIVYLQVLAEFSGSLVKGSHKLAVRVKVPPVSESFFQDKLLFLTLSHFDYAAYCERVSTSGNMQTPPSATLKFFRDSDSTSHKDHLMIMVQFRKQLFDCCAVVKDKGDCIICDKCDSRHHITCKFSAAQLVEFGEVAKMVGDAVFDFVRREAPYYYPCGCMGNSQYRKTGEDEALAKQFTALAVKEKRAQIINEEEFDGTIESKNTVVIVPDFTVEFGVSLGSYETIYKTQDESKNLDDLSLLHEIIGYCDELEPLSLFEAEDLPNDRAVPTPIPPNILHATNSLYLAVVFHHCSAFYYVGIAKNGIRDRWHGKSGMMKGLDYRRKPTKPGTSSHFGKAATLQKKRKMQIQAVDALVSRVGTDQVWIIALGYTQTYEELSTIETAIIEKYHLKEANGLNMRL
jgi:hypothetical protein